MKFNCKKCTWYMFEGGTGFCTESNKDKNEKYISYVSN